MKPKPPKRSSPLGFPLPPRRIEGATAPPRAKVKPIKLDLGPDDDEDFDRGSEVQAPKGRRAARTRPPQQRPVHGRPRPYGKPQAPRPTNAVPTSVRPQTPLRPVLRETVHVANLDLLARSTVEVAEVVERAVFKEKKRADRALAAALRDRRDLAQADHRFISQAVMALFRWHGWVETLHLPRIEERLMLSSMLDTNTVHPVCRTWARRLDRDPGKLSALGGAPNWTARGEGWKRLLGGAPVNADPWRLFPQWIREHLPLPPGGAPAKVKWLDLLHAMQGQQALWVRAQGKEAKQIWGELSGLGLKPWIHRELTSSAKLDRDADVHHLPPFQRGELEIQDLSSQIVSLVCSPDPGERWWDVCSGAGGKALHLAALMGGKGLVVASDVNEKKLSEAIRRARRSPFRNVTTKAWDGKHVVGKAGKYDGVLVDAPCSAIGTWRRNPDARWLLEKEAIPRLAETQSQILKAAAAGVRPGGTLVYSVCTLTPLETTRVVQTFLEAHPQFKLDPFKNPLTGEATDGTLQIWPQDADSDAMFIARMIRKSTPA